MTLYGFGGRTLRINLKSGEIKKTETDPELARNWLGARGFVSKILYDEVPRNADPLGPENRLIVAPGVFTGLFIPSGSKCGFGAVSPASNSHADSSVGGHFGPELKFAGYDLIVFEDKSPEPSYLYINDDVVEIRSAEQYWGMGALDAEAALKKDLGDDFQIVTIGPAGERGVYFACISHDFGRQSGRCGIGAVMGSKNLKAIAVKGTKSIPVKDLESLYKESKTIMIRTRKHPNMAPWQRLGTALFVGWSNEHGAFPTRNFQTSYFNDWQKIDGEVLKKECVVIDKACFGCWMNCGKYSHHQKQGSYDVMVEGPEYETIALIGGSCAISDIRDVGYGNYLCDNLGVDTISGGSVVAFAMECYEKGIITKKDLDGRELRWGSIEDFEFLLRKIAFREGIGDIFARGSRGAALILGRDSIKFAIQQKGLEFSGYECRWAPSQLLSFMTGDIGAHHNRSWSITVDIEKGRDIFLGKAKHIVYLQHIRPFFDTASICRLFWGEVDVMPEEYVKALILITGWNITTDEILKISEKIWNLNRIHLLLRNGGPGRKHDLPPARNFEEPIPDGPAKGKIIPREMVDRMLDEYYEARAWDNDGNPTEELLKDLGLSNTIDELKQNGLLGKPIPGGIPQVRGEVMKPRAM